jgi:hypothetical protein
VCESVPKPDGWHIGGRPQDLRAHASTSRLYRLPTMARYPRFVVSEEHCPNAANGHDTVGGFERAPSHRAGATDAPFGDVPLAAQTPDAAPGPASTPASPPASRGKRRVLRALAYALASVVMVGGIAGIVVYDQATKIDRGTPAASARQFLRAALTDRDVTKVGLFVCSSWPADQAMSEVLAGMDLSAVISWSVGTVQQTDDRSAAMVVRVLTTIGSEAVVAEAVDQWVLEAVNENGWRICGVRRN